MAKLLKGRYEAKPKFQKEGVCKPNNHLWWRYAYFLDHLNRMFWKILLHFYILTIFLDT